MQCVIFSGTGFLLASVAGARLNMLTHHVRLRSVFGFYFNNLKANATVTTTTSSSSKSESVFVGFLSVSSRELGATLHQLMMEFFSGCLSSSSNFGHSGLRSAPPRQIHGYAASDQSVFIKSVITLLDVTHEARHSSLNRLPMLC